MATARTVNLTSWYMGDSRKELRGKRSGLPQARP
jgi:hypothetical protein